jgi:hypothetical protein
MSRIRAKSKRTNIQGIDGVVLRITAAVVVLAIAVTFGCSRTNEPESYGTISLRLYQEAPGPGDVVFSPAQVLDSVVVRVFRGQTTVTHETSYGTAINGPGEVDMTITCVAEQDKKVSVELFEGESMWYFGVDEHVDVVENENTDVTIDAWDFHIDRVNISPPTVVEGTAYNVTWSSAVAVGSYLLAESTDPDFPQQFTQSYLTTDTVMTFQRPPGAHYYAVVPMNQYAVGTMSEVAYGYVQTVGEQPPQVTGASPSHASPGELVTVVGFNLDVPGRVLLNDVECPIVSASERELVFVVPLAAQSGAITLETLMGIVIPNPPIIVTVDRIAYVTTAGEDQDGYIQLIRNEPSITSGVAVVPLAELADRDMRVFDVIIVAHDVANGSFGPGSAEILAIANSGANVLAIGRGGQGYLALVFSEVNGSVSSDTPSDRSVQVLESWPVFQSPELIPMQGPDTVEISSTDEPFSAFDFDAVVPAQVTLYASLSSASSHIVLLDVAATGAFQQPLHNFFWGFEGDPANLLPGSGRQLMINVLSYLVSAKTSTPTFSDRP